MAKHNTEASAPLDRDYMDLLPCGREKIKAHEHDMLEVDVRGCNTPDETIDHWTKVQYLF
jgi:hypothetical protein